MRETLENMMVLTMEQSIIAVNPQASLCELSWLGGIVDGEGCITVDKRTNQNGRKQQCVAPLVTIVNTDALLTTKVEKILRDNGLAFHIRIHPAKGNWRAKIEITIAGQKRVMRFLNLVQPYLVSKAHKASILRQFCESREGKTGPYSEEEKAMCRLIWKLNGRGTQHW